MKRALVSSVLCAALALPASALAADLDAGDLAGAQALTQAFEKAVNAGDAVAVAALYSDDALLMPPHAPVLQGPLSIQAFMEEFPKVTDLHCTDMIIQGKDGLVYVAGTYSMTLHPEGADPIQDDGKYLDVRRKDPDGTWRFVADMFNTSVPDEE